MKKRLFTRVVSIILALSMMLVILPATPTTSVAAADLASTIKSAEGVTNMLGMLGSVGSAASVGFQFLNIVGLVKSKEDIMMEKLNQIIETLDVMNKKLDQIQGQLMEQESKIDGISQALTDSSYSAAFTNLNNKYVSPYSTTLTSDFRNSYEAFVNGVRDGFIDQNGGVIYNTVGSEKKTMEFQVSGTDLQYRYTGEMRWKALCKLTDCSGGGSYAYRVKTGYVEWCPSTSDQGLDKNWTKDDYGIVYYVNQKVNSGRNGAYMSISVLDALKSYFKQGARIDKYTGVTDKNSTKLVQSFDGNSLTLSNDTIALAGLLTNNSFMPELYDTTLYDYIDSYYIYRTMKDGFSYDRSYAAREALRDLFNGMFLQGACISYLYLEYLSLSNPGADYSANLSSLDNAVGNVVTAVAEDPFLDEMAAKRGESDTKYALFKGSIADTTVQIRNNTTSQMTVISCANTENAVIVMPKIYENQKIKVIGDNAFKGKTNITGALLPDALIYIGKDAFTGCTGLTSLEIPASVTACGMHPFADCTTPNITVNGTVIPEYFFAYAKFANYTVSDTVTVIGSGAFFGTYALNTVNIPNSVLMIGNYAFANSLVSTVNIEGNPRIVDYAIGFAFLTMVDKLQPVSGASFYESDGILWGYDDAKGNYFNRDIKVDSFTMEADKNKKHYRALIAPNRVFTVGHDYGVQLPDSVVLNCPADAPNVLDYSFGPLAISQAYYFGTYNYEGWNSANFYIYDMTTRPSVQLQLGGVSLPKATYENSIKPAVVSTSADAAESDPELDKLFDGDIHTAYSGNPSTTVYLDYDAPFTLRSYSFTTADDVESHLGWWTPSTINPLNWKVYGSNDKESWSLLSSVDNSDRQKLPPKNSSLASFVKETHLSAYPHYKIVFNDSPGNGTFKLPEIMLFDKGKSGDSKNLTFRDDGSAFVTTLNSFAGSLFGDGTAGGYILIGVLAFVLGAGAGVGGVFLRKRAGKKRRKEDGAEEPTDESVKVSADEAPDETEQPPEVSAPPQSSETREEATVTK